MTGICQAQLLTYPVRYVRALPVLCRHFTVVSCSAIPLPLITNKEKGGFYTIKPIKPGTDNQEPGRYIEVGPNGEQADNPRMIHINRGDRLPPTQQSGNKWLKIE